MCVSLFLLRILLLMLFSCAGGVVGVVVVVVNDRVTVIGVEYVYVILVFAMSLFVVVLLVLRIYLLLLRHETDGVVVVISDGVDVGAVCVLVFVVGVCVNNVVVMRRLCCVWYVY